MIITKVSKAYRVVLLLMFVFIFACRNDKNASTLQKQEQANTSETGMANNIPQVKQLTAQIAADSANADLYFLRGNVYLQANTPELASADFYRALALDSLNSAYYLAAADVFFMQKDLPTAIKLLEKAQQTLPDSVNIKTELGKYYYYIQDYDKSVNALNTVTGRQPQNADAWFWLGMNYRDKKENAKAIASFTRAVQADASFYNAYMVMANLQAQNKDSKALDNYSKAIALDTASVEARYGRALFLQNTGKTKEALDEYRQIVLIDPQHADTHYNVGYIYFNNKDYETALKSFTMAVGTSPTFAKAYYMRGLCAEKLGKTANARTDYESALKFDPQLTLAKEALTRVQ
ncbi:tetratricopeptide repeat protein [Sphingobacteriales bacterium UPWRP_1]|nr:hypothetical protein BVG80_10475 [Sphingobacteriales bacterium TSM_CSM]PSJ78842.1 tetratricopeptide repeat protein [Sphingobacteriales bacterium UPWRP_1]